MTVQLGQFFIARLPPWMTKRKTKRNQNWKIASHRLSALVALGFDLVPTSPEQARSQVEVVTNIVNPRQLGTNETWLSYFLSPRSRHQSQRFQTSLSKSMSGTRPNARRATIAGKAAAPQFSKIFGYRDSYISITPWLHLHTLLYDGSCTALHQSHYPCLTNKYLQLGSIVYTI